MSRFLCVRTLMACLHSCRTQHCLLQCAGSWRFPPVSHHPFLLHLDNWHRGQYVGGGGTSQLGFCSSHLCLGDERGSEQGIKHFNLCKSHFPGGRQEGRRKSACSGPGQVVHAIAPAPKLRMTISKTTHSFPPPPPNTAGDADLRSVITKRLLPNLMLFDHGLVGHVVRRTWGKGREGRVRGRPQRAYLERESKLSCGQRQSRVSCRPRERLKGRQTGGHDRETLHTTTHCHFSPEQVWDSHITPDEQGIMCKAGGVCGSGSDMCLSQGRSSGQQSPLSWVLRGVMRRGTEGTDFSDQP